MTDWVCARCGNPAKPIESAFGSYHEIAEGFATGYCDTCSVAHPKTPRKKPRPVSQLIAAHRFDRAGWEEGKERDELRRLVHQASAPGARVSMSDHELLRLVTLYDRYGMPGFLLLPEWREDAAKYAARGGR